MALSKFPKREFKFVQMKSLAMRRPTVEGSPNEKKIKCDALCVILPKLLAYRLCWCMSFLIVFCKFVRSLPDGYCICIDRYEYTPLRNCSNCCFPQNSIKRKSSNIVTGYETSVQIFNAVRISGNKIRQAKHASLKHVTCSKE